VPATGSAAVNLNIISHLGAQEFPNDRRVIAAANQEFSGAVSAAHGTAQTQPGWDPYEVWLTRVKAPAIR
jgi:hypothetical protein